MPNLFEGVKVLKNPLTHEQFTSYRQDGRIVAYLYNRESKRPYEEVNILDSRELSSFGKKVVTGISSLIIGAITYASYVNFVK
jgi:hypothetical protein